MSRGNTCVVCTNSNHLAAVCRERLYPIAADASVLKLLDRLAIILPSATTQYFKNVSCCIFESFCNFKRQSSATYQFHTGKCIRRFGGIYAYCRYFIDRKWSILVLILYIKTCHMPKGL